MSSVMTNPYNTELTVNLFPNHIPFSVKSLPKLLQSTDELLFKQVCLLCKQYLRDKCLSKKTYLQTKESAIRSHGLDANGFDLLLNATLMLTINCDRIGGSYSSESIESQLIKGIHLEKSFVTIFLNQLFDTKSVDKSLCPPRRQSYSLRSIRWRIDVSICNSMLSRIMEPLIVFELVVITNDTNNCHKYRQQLVVFECKSAEFHRLRFTVADAITRMNQLQH